MKICSGNYTKIGYLLKIWLPSCTYLPAVDLDLAFVSGVPCRECRVGSGLNAFQIIFLYLCESAVFISGPRCCLIVANCPPAGLCWDLGHTSLFGCCLVNFLGG